MTRAVASKVPPWIDAAPSVEDEARLIALRAMTPEERLERFLQACALAAAILRDRPDGQEILERREPLDPETERRWQALVAEGLRARQAR